MDQSQQERGLEQRNDGVTSAYIRDAERELQEVTFFNHGGQLTRSFRELKAWLFIQTAAWTPSARRWRGTSRK